MATKTIDVLVPTAKSRTEEISIPPRIHDLNDKVVGFLWNSKANADILLLRIKEQLSQRFRLAGTDWQQKPGVGGPAPAAIIEELIRTSDLVINASCD
ncbi:hypothetical protein ACFLVG_00335 [Chloroflexota bacterium]